MHGLELDLVHGLELDLVHGLELDLKHGSLVDFADGSEVVDSQSLWGPAEGVDSENVSVDLRWVPNRETERFVWVCLPEEGNCSVVNILVNIVVQVVL